MAFDGENVTGEPCLLPFRFQLIVSVSALSTTTAPWPLTSPPRWNDGVPPPPGKVTAMFTFFVVFGMMRISLQKKHYYRDDSGCDRRASAALRYPLAVSDAMIVRASDVWPRLHSTRAKTSRRLWLADVRAAGAIAS